MTDHELFRRALSVLWLGAFGYFAVAWYAGVGWVGPVWVLGAWSWAAVPLYATTTAFVHGVGAVRRWELWVTLCVWAGLLVPYVVPELVVLQAFPNGLAAFWAVVAAYTVFALGVITRSLVLLRRARRGSPVEPVGFPRRATAVLGIGAIVSMGVIAYLALRPTHAFTVITVPDSTTDVVQAVWNDVLSVPMKNGALPDGVAGLARVRGPNDAPAIYGRFRPGTSHQKREILLERLREQPGVVAVETHVLK